MVISNYQMDEHCTVVLKNNWSPLDVIRRKEIFLAPFLSTDDLRRYRELNKTSYDQVA